MRASNLWGLEENYVEVDGLGADEAVAGAAEVVAVFVLVVFELLAAEAPEVSPPFTVSLFFASLVAEVPLAADAAAPAEDPALAPLLRKSVTYQPEPFS